MDHLEGVSSSKDGHQEKKKVLLCVSDSPHAATPASSNKDRQSGRLMLPPG